MSKISMPVSVRNDSFLKQYTQAVELMYKRSDINLVRGLHILHTSFKVPVTHDCCKLSLDNADLNLFNALGSSGGNCWGKI